MLSLKCIGGLIIVQTLEYIKKNVPCDRSILETGCGCAENLFWLAQNHYTDLSGFDLDKNVIKAAKEIAATTKYKIHLYNDDALQPVVPNHTYDVVIALGWTFMVENFDLIGFLKSYKSVLRQGGLIIMDIIDESFNNEPNNIYLTEDWDLPERDRRPTNYLVRCAHSEVANACSLSSYKIERVFSQNETVPKVVYVLRTE